MRLSPWWALACGGLALAAVFVRASAGALGPLVTCGADGAQVCIVWPRMASAVLWLTFVWAIVGLVVVQARQYRHVSVARRELGLLSVVLVLALVERLWRVDLTDVGYDEASAASLVAAWRLDGLFPLTGIVSSVNIANPPGWPYLLTLTLWWWDSPYAVIALGVVTGLLAIAATWLVARRWIGPWGALGGAIFYAGGFWASFLERGGWQPVFLQVPVILCLDAVLMLAATRRPWALAIAFGWLALMIQLHYIALVFVLMLPFAAWPARHVLRPVHLATGLLLAGVLLAPFIIYELNPAVRFRDFALLSEGASGQGSHWDLEAWNLLWTLASNRGVAGVAGPDSAGLQQALGRWSNLGLLGVPLVALGLLAAAAGWPRGWSGATLVAWNFTLPLGLAHHTLGLLFHYLYLGLPGMALAVGALFEWSGFRGRVLVRAMVAAALAVYVGISAATLQVVLAQVERTGTYPGSARPLGVTMSAVDATRAYIQPGTAVLIGGKVWEVEMLRFALGHDLRARVFDDCAPVPQASDSVYLLNSEYTPAAAALDAAGAPLLARVRQPDGDAFRVYGTPTGVIPATSC